MRVAEAVAPGLDLDDVGPAFGRLLPEVFGHLEESGARQGIAVGHYEYEGVAWPDDGTIVLHAGVDIGDQTIDDTDQVRVTTLPGLHAACAVHRGPMDDLPAAWEALVRWVEDSGYRLAGQSRELYRVWDDEDPNGHVTELQVAVTC
jgi:effector-binding domain-containing protein